MSSATVTVPGEHVGELRRTLIGFYGAAAEELFHLANGYLERKEPVEVLLDHRRHLVDVDELISSIGWEFPPGPQGDVELRGKRRLLATVLQGVLLELGERIPELCRRCWLGETDPAQLGDALLAVMRFVPLVARLDDGPHAEGSAANENDES